MGLVLKKQAPAPEIIRRVRNKPLQPKFLAKIPIHPIVRWLDACNEKYDIRKDVHFMECRKKGGAAPIGDGRYTNVKGKVRNIRIEREKAIYVLRRLILAFLNVFPFEGDSAPFEVEISVWQLAEYGNMLRRYDKNYDQGGIYRHGRVAADICYAAIKELALAGYVIPITSRVEEGEKKGHYKPARLFLTREFFESMGVSYVELRKKQAAYRNKLKEKGTWDKECHKQAVRLAKRLKRANLTQMSIAERDQLLEQIERCRRHVSHNVIELEKYRNKIKQENKKAHKHGERKEMPEGLSGLCDKIKIFDADELHVREMKREAARLQKYVQETIAAKAIDYPSQMKLESLAKEEVQELSALIVDKADRVCYDIEYYRVLLDLVKNWAASRSSKEPPS